MPDETPSPPPAPTADITLTELYALIGERDVVILKLNQALAALRAAQAKPPE